MAINCPVCGAENPDSAEFCNLCLVSMTVGTDEYTTPTSSNEGFLPHYPSSFDEGAPSAEEVAASDGKTPHAAPTDIGEYGVRSGQTFDERTGALAGHGLEGPPVDSWLQNTPTEDIGKDTPSPYDPALQQQVYQEPGYSSLPTRTSRPPIPAFTGSSKRRPGRSRPGRPGSRGIRGLIRARGRRGRSIGRGPCCCAPVPEL